jgi:hypothetical protein
VRQIFDSSRQQLELAKRELASLAAAEAGLAGDAASLAWSLKALRAFTVQNVYSGIERILRTVVERVDGRAFSGSDWHASLLAEAASVKPEVRPAVLGAETLRLLDQLRRFRHVARHHYGVRLDEEGVEDNLALTRRVLPLFEADLAAFEAAMTRDEGAGPAPA